jgi:hypothetical protein
MESAFWFIMGLYCGVVVSVIIQIIIEKQDKKDLMFPKDKGKKW